MKKNIILLLFTLILGIFFLEFAASHEINSLIKRNGFTKELIDFYDSYYRILHHLKGLHETDSNNISSLMFDELGNGKSNVIIQGDSWAQQYRAKRPTEYLTDFLKKNTNIKLILAGTGSYSPCIMTAQLNLLRNEFNFRSDYIIAVIDQTDIGDELCRYRGLREKNNNRIIVKPEPKNSLEPNSMYFIIDNFKMFFSKNFSLYKVLYYFKNLYTYKELKKKYKIKCGGNQILNPLRNELHIEDKKYIISVLNDYFDEVFSDNSLKKLIIVTHPHEGHLTGEYSLNIETLIVKVIEDSIYKNKIKILSFLKEVEKYSNEEIENIFVDNDPYSHLKEDYFLNEILPKVLNEID